MMMTMSGQMMSRAGIPPHNQPIGAVALNSRCLLAAGSYDGDISLWSVEGDRAVCRMKHRAHAKGVNAISFSPDARLVASGGSDGTAVIMNCDTGQTVTVEHPTDVECVLFNPIGTRLFTGGTDGKGRIWDAATGELIVTLAHGKTVGAAANLDGLLVTGSNDAKVRLFTWDGKLTKESKIATQPIKSLAPVLGGLAVGAHDGVVRWADATLEHVTEIARFATTPKSMAATSDGMLYIGAYDQTISVLRMDRANGAMSAQVKAAWRQPNVWAHAIAANDRRLAIGSFDGAPQIWRLARTPEGDVSVRSVVTRKAPSDGISGLTFDRANSRLLVSGDHGDVRELKIDRLKTGIRIRRAGFRRLCSLGAGITDLKAYADGFIVCTWDGRIVRFGSDGGERWTAAWQDGKNIGACPVLKIDADDASNTVVAGLYSGGTAFFEADTGRLRAVQKESTGAVKSVGVRGRVFAATGRYDPLRVGYVSDPKTIRARLALDTPVSDYVVFSTWKTEGQPERLAVVAKNNEVWVVDVIERAGDVRLDVVHRGEGHRLPVKALLFNSHDSVLAGDYDGVIAQHRVGAPTRSVLSVRCRLGISALAIVRASVVWSSFDGSVGVIPGLAIA